MDCWAIIPVKSFAQGKSRLSGVLGAEQRAALNRHLFGRVLQAAQGAFSATRIAVVTSDPLLLALVRGHGMHGLEDAGGGLNAALGQGCRHAVERGARAVAVVPSDLPMIAAADVTALVAALGRAPSCVIAPDEQEQGTNALAIAPAEADFFSFGKDSFQAHLGAARARGMTVRILRREAFAYDLDTPESYRLYAKLAPSGAPA
jgi:2-phospho-L-lactate/phosphoenolpyruvate guanylyltransferase